MTFEYIYNTIVHENRNSQLKTSDGKHNLMKKWGNMEKAN
jgi:hypothetical protein